MRSVQRIFLSGLFVGVFSILMLSTRALAGGGRMMLYTMSGSPYNIKEARILAQVYKEGSQDTGWSVGEKMEFRIVNPQPGDYCKTDDSPTKENGFIGAWCYADSAREMEVYLYSLDLSDRSGSYILHFIDEPKSYAAPYGESKATATPIATPRPTATPISTPIATPLFSPASSDYEPFDTSDMEPELSYEEDLKIPRINDDRISDDQTNEKQNFWQFAFEELKRYFTSLFRK